MTMTQPKTSYVTRRATTEDLPQLAKLWRQARLPAAVLEKRFTEFQLVTDDVGRVFAAIGIQIAGTQGLLHSEAIAQAESADTLRDLLWKRLQVVIQNHALEWLWTQMNADQWRERGFESANAEQRKTVPAAFSAGPGEWQVMKLRAATAAAAVENEWAQLKTLQQEEAARLKERVQWMKRLALGITVIVFLLVVAWAVVLLKIGPRLFHGR